MKTLIWSLFALIALLWTGLAVLSVQLADWALAAMAQGTAQWNPADLPAWLSIWLDPAWLQALQALWADWVPALVSVLPSGDSLGQWITVLVWLCWGLGLIALLVGAVALHWLAGQFGPKLRNGAPA